MEAGSLPGVKRLRRVLTTHPTSSAEVKERVELYIYSPFVACCRASFIFNFTFLTSAPPVCLRRVLLQRWGSSPFLYSYPSFRDFEGPGYRSWYIDWATGWTIWCSNSGSGKTFFCPLKPPCRLCKPRRLLFNGYRSSLKQWS
jgi:hypothetical protein